MATSSHLDLLVHTNVIMIISDCQRSSEVKKLHDDATSINEAIFPTPVTPGNEFRIAVHRRDIKSKPKGAGQIGDAAQTPSDRGYGREASAL
jgi:hypothetical protein